eukprot:m.91800 g.91800  ORF g.91800 m.91800 type:complete len:150 (+) comp15050_c1_seq3:805-1254(+)
MSALKAERVFFPGRSVFQSLSGTECRTAGDVQRALLGCSQQSPSQQHQQQHHQQQPSASPPPLITAPGGRVGPQPATSASGSPSPTTLHRGRNLMLFASTETGQLTRSSPVTGDVIVVQNGLDQGGAGCLARFAHPTSTKRTPPSVFPP